MWEGPFETLCLRSLFFSQLHCCRLPATLHELTFKIGLNLDATNIEIIYTYIHTHTPLFRGEQYLPLHREKLIAVSMKKGLFTAHILIYL